MNLMILVKPFNPPPAIIGTKPFIAKAPPETLSVTLETLGTVTTQATAIIPPKYAAAKPTTEITIPITLAAGFLILIMEITNKTKNRMANKPTTAKVTMLGITIDEKSTKDFNVSALK